MNPNLMSNAQQSTTPTRRLAPGEALTLPAATHARWLQVQDGELWLTAAADLPGDELPEDRWLRRGACWLVPAGEEVVLEGHPAASFRLTEAAEADEITAQVYAAWPSASARARSSVPAWRAWAQHWSLLPGPPSGEPCAACL